jgi:hypothetical protein
MCYSGEHISKVKDSEHACNIDFYLRIKNYLTDSEISEVLKNKVLSFQ